MKKIFKLVEQIEKEFKKYLISEIADPAEVRKKHIRLGVIVFIVFIGSCYLIQTSSAPKISHKLKQINLAGKNEKQEKIKTSPGLEELAKGTSNERLWTEIEGKEIEKIKKEQEAGTELQRGINEKLENNKVSKEEMENIILGLTQKLEEKYEQKLAWVIGQLKQEESKKQLDTKIETKTFITKKKSYRVGEYIPANSYAEGKLISGVDAGVGMTAEANPRQALLRITGDVVSAGFGSKYLKTDKLIGCQMSLRAVGDISSEKVYLEGVLMSCAIDDKNFIEIPVKAYVSSMGKAGIRGEIVSREGDMVLKSFVAGIASGFGSGVTAFSQPQHSILGNNAPLSDGDRIKNLLSGGLGSGVSQGSNSLADFFIKRAEQYQPVISVNEGTPVNIVFLEGFSLKGDDKNE